MSKKKANPLDNLSAKQRKYVERRTKGDNKYQAGKASGYTESMSLKANSKIETPEVLSAIRALIQDQIPEEDLKKIARQVLLELSRLAFLDPRKMYKEDGSLKSISELDPDTAACIAGFDIEDLYEHFKQGGAKQIGTVKKIKFADKGQNLERLGRWLKLFTDKHEISGKNGGAIEIKDMTDDELKQRVAAIESHLGYSPAVITAGGDARTQDGAAAPGRAQ